MTLSSTRDVPIYSISAFLSSFHPLVISSHNARKHAGALLRAVRLRVNVDVEVVWNRQETAMEANVSGA